MNSVAGWTEPYLIFQGPHGGGSSGVHIITSTTQVTVVSVSAPPKDCGLFSRLWDATSLNPKIGFGLELGRADAEVTVAYSDSTESWSANAELSVFGFGPSASRQMTYGNLIPSNTDTDPKFTFDTPMSQTDLVTGKTSVGPSASKFFRVGATVGVGGDISFDPAAFRQSGAVCSARLGG